MIESKFQAEVLWLLRKMDCLCSKQKERSMPDYLVVIPGGGSLFIEFKSSIGKLSALQARRVAKLRGMGSTVYVLSPRTSIDVLQIMRNISYYSAPYKKLFLSQIIDVMNLSRSYEVSWGDSFKRFLIEDAAVIPQNMRRLGLKHLLSILWESN